MTTLDKISYSFDLLFTLTQKEMKVRYRSNVLGYCWSVLNPLGQALVYYVAFQFFMRFEMEDYLLFLLTGLFPWQGFAYSVGMSPQAFLDQPALIKKVLFPRFFLPLTMILQNMIHLLLSLPVLVGFLLWYGRFPGVIWFWAIPLLLVSSLSVIVGLSLLLSTVNLFFRDLANMTTIGLQMLFFMTPILYSIDQIPPELQKYLLLNPVAPLFITWRAVLLENLFPWTYYSLSLVSGALFLALGCWIYAKLSWRFAEIL